jgi:hypothetical protein
MKGALIIGGNASGVQAVLDLAESGIKAYSRLTVEKVIMGRDELLSDFLLWHASRVRDAASDAPPTFFTLNSSKTFVLRRRRDIAHTARHYMGDLGMDVLHLLQLLAESLPYPTLHSSLFTSHLSRPMSSRETHGGLR